MKVTVTEVRDLCDICKTASAWHGCDDYGKMVCHDCQKGHTVEMHQSVYFGGSGYIRYCLECYTKLLEKPTPLFLAYRVIESLRAESKAWSADFEKRYKAAEERLLQVKEGDA